MTAGNGFSPGVDRFGLDAGTAERLLTGAVDVADAPPQYRAVAATLLALKQPAESREFVGGPAAAERIADAVVLERTVSTVPRSRRSAFRVRIVATAVAACGLVLTGGLAAAGALPEQAQGVAAAVLRQIGISVPNGDEKPADHRPPVTTSTPAPTTAPSVQPSPASGNPDAPPSPQHANPTPTLGTGPAVPNGAQTHAIPPPAQTHAIPPPAETGSGKGLSPAGAPQGNGYGIGNGDANVNGKNGIGSGNANGNGNGKPGGNANANPNAPETPHAHGNAGGNGTGNGNGRSAP